MTLPQVSQPEVGIFILRRLSALAKKCPVTALRPVPWFPIVKPAIVRDWVSMEVPICERRMLYFPGIAKWLDGWWMERCVYSWLRSQFPLPKNLVLDAHFGYPEGVGCVSVARRLRLPCFVSLRGVEVDWFKQPKVRPQLVRTLQQATGVIAVSQSLRDLAVEQGVAPSHVAVIPNGCDKETFGPGNQEDARRRLGLEVEGKLIVCVANLKPVKGHDILLRSVSKLRGSFRLLLIGDSDSSGYKGALHRLASQVGIAQSVEFLGMQPPQRVADYLRAADLFVLASRREGCCNALIEAVATGCRVVATDVGDNGKILRSHAARRLVSAGEIEQLTVAMQEMLDTEVLSMVPQPQSFPSWDEIAQNTIEFISDRINAGRLAI